MTPTDSVLDELPDLGPRKPPGSHTERSILDGLHRRYTADNGNGDRWVRAEHVRNGTGFMGWSDDHQRCVGPLRTIDFIALDMYESKGHRIIGHEVKISRSDWLRELAEPDKGEAWARWCHDFYVVAPKGVVRAGELPAGWGLLTVPLAATLPGSISQPRLTHRSIRPAPEPMPRAIQFGLARAIQKTAARKATS